MLVMLRSYVYLYPIQSIIALLILYSDYFNTILKNHVLIIQLTFCQQQYKACIANKHKFVLVCGENNILLLESFYFSTDLHIVIIICIYPLINITACNVTTMKNANFLFWQSKIILYAQFCIKELFELEKNTNFLYGINSVDEFLNTLSTFK